MKAGRKLNNFDEDFKDFNKPEELFSEKLKHNSMLEPISQGLTKYCLRITYIIKNLEKQRQWNKDWQHVRWQQYHGNRWDGNICHGNRWDGNNVKATDEMASSHCTLAFSWGRKQLFLTFSNLVACVFLQCRHLHHWSVFHTCTGNTN